MKLEKHQGLIIYSESILSCEKLQALIHNITEDYITIYIPVSHVNIKEGTDLKVNFWDENATYEFDSITFSPLSSSSTINIARPKALRKIINRAYPRVAVKIKGFIFDLDHKKESKCLILNISAGGVLVSSAAGRSVNDNIKLNFTLPNGTDFLDVAGEIIWAKNIKDGTSHAHYGIKFQFLSQIRRRKLVKFVNSKITEKYKKT